MNLFPKQCLCPSACTLFWFYPLLFRTNVMESLADFCLSLLLIANKEDSRLFDSIYNKLCTTLCNVYPRSLMDQPAVIQNTYDQIQSMLSELVRDPTSL